jgi:hypothetical protein
MSMIAVMLLALLVIATVAGTERNGTSGIWKLAAGLRADVALADVGGHLSAQTVNGNVSIPDAGDPRYDEGQERRSNDDGQQRYEAGQRPARCRGATCHRL